MQTVAEPIAFPPLEAFLIQPRFVVSDLWVWPLYVVLAYLWIRGIHRAAGLKGRDIDLLLVLRVLNGLLLWGTLIAVSNAVHRVTDDVIVSGLWVGVILTLSNLAYRAVLKYTPMAPVDQRARAAIDAHRAEMKVKQEAYKQAKARGEMFVDLVPKAPDAPAAPPPRRQRVHVARDSPADARQQVSVLMRRDLFADPEPASPTPAEPAPEAEKPPVA
jgi:hypothetical protein